MPERRARSSARVVGGARFDNRVPHAQNGRMRFLIGLGLMLCLAGSAAGQGLPGMLDRQEIQRGLQQSELRRESERQGQDLQRQLDLGRLQQQIERQQTIRQAPIPCATVNPTTIC